MKSLIAVIVSYVNEGAKIQAFKAALAAVGGLVVHLLGGGDGAVKLFGALIIFDYLLGALKGLKTGTFKSSIMRWGAVNKSLEVIVIMVFNVFDGTMHIDIFRNGAIVWFCICEAASVFENLVLLGVPCPEGLHKTLEKLKVGVSVSFVDILERLVEEKLQLKKGENKDDSN